MWKSNKDTAWRPASGTRQRIRDAFLYCTGDMTEFRKLMNEKPFAMQLVEWSFRGMAQVIMVDNPLSGVLVLAALLVESPWQAVLGILGLLASTFTAIIIGLDSTEVTRGLHGCNGMLVTLLMGVFSSSGDWYWWLLVPGCLAAATCTFLHSGLRPLLDPWDLPVSVFPFNTVILLYLSCTGSTNPYFPHHPAERPVAPEHSNNTHLQGLQLLQGVVRGVGQIYACEELWPSLLILLAVLIGSPLLCIHALLGSGAGLLAGLSVAVRCTWLYAGLSGFNGALGCMAVGGLFFKFNWKTHLLSITSAFLSSYGDIALSNLLGTVGLPACSWAATLTVSLMLLLTAHNLSSYRIPLGRVMFPETHQEAQAHRAGADMHSTDV
nr:urea transporter 1-like isoform X1 [Paramormyrops kingsleyae]